MQAANLKLSASCQVECQNKSLEQELLISVCVCENWAISRFLQVRKMAQRQAGKDYVLSAPTILFPGGSKVNSRPAKELE